MDLSTHSRMISPRAVTMSLLIAFGLNLCVLTTCNREEQNALGAVDDPNFETPSIPTLPPSPSPSTVHPENLADPALGIAEPLEAAVDLSVQITGTNALRTGESMVFTVTVWNNGPGAATGIVLTDTLAKGLVPLWVEPAHPACGRQGRSVDCGLGRFLGGDAVTVTLDLSEGAGKPIIISPWRASSIEDQGLPECTLPRRPNQVVCGLDRLSAGEAVQLRLGARFDYWEPDKPLHNVVVMASEMDDGPADNRIEYGLDQTTVNNLEGTQDASGPPSPDLNILTDGPDQVIAGRPFTTTFTVSNVGAQEATGIYFESALPPATTLVAYAPDLPDCERRSDALVCELREPDSGGSITFTLAITGHAGQPMIIEPDPLMPGWPICIVIEERSYLQIVNCELGTLAPGHETPVQLTLIAEGVQERDLSSTALVWADEPDLSPADNVITTTAAVSVRTDLTLESTVLEADTTERTVRYTLTAANLGPSDATDVIIRDSWPAKSRLISTLSSLGEECLVEMDDSATTVLCELGRLGRGETVHLDLVVMVDEAVLMPPLEVISHRAVVESAQIDPDLENNVWDEEIPVSSLIDR